MPLVDDTSLDGRLRRLRARFPQRRVGADQRLAQIVARPLEDQSFWTKASAIHVMGSRPADGFRDAIISALADPEPVVRETAVWALARLGPADLAGYLDPLTRDRSTNVAQMARFAMSGVAQ